MTVVEREPRSTGLLVLTLMGAVALVALTWVIVYEPAYRPWIFNDRYPVPFSDLFSRLIQVNDTRAGSNIYLPLNPQEFTYPPAAIILFIPLTYLSALHAFAVWTLTSMLCLAVTYLIVLRATGKASVLKHVTIAIWACTATVIVFPPMSEMLNLGQTGTIILLLLTADFLAVQNRSQGMLVGVAAAIKLYPAVFILFWILRRRWRPAVTACVTFVLYTATAWLVWPRDSAWFFGHTLPSGEELRIIRTTPGYVIRDSSITGFFLHISVFPQSLSVVLGLFASVAIGIIGILIAARLDRLHYPVCALVMLLCISVLISPVAWDHYFVFAPLLVFVILEVKLKSVGGKLAAVALVIFTVPWFPFHNGVLHPTILDDIRNVVSINALFVAALLVVVACSASARDVRAVAFSQEPAASFNDGAD